MSKLCNKSGHLCNKSGKLTCLCAPEPCGLCLSGTSPTDIVLYIKDSASMFNGIWNLTFIESIQSNCFYTHTTEDVFFGIELNKNSLRAIVTFYKFVSPYWTHVYIKQFTSYINCLTDLLGIYSLFSNEYTDNPTVEVLSAS